MFVYFFKIQIVLKVWNLRQKILILNLTFVVIYGVVIYLIIFWKLSIIMDVHVWLLYFLINLFIDLKLGIYHFLVCEPIHYTHRSSIEWLKKSLKSTIIKRGFRWSGPILRSLDFGALVIALSFKHILLSYNKVLIYFFKKRQNSVLNCGLKFPVQLVTTKDALFFHNCRCFILN